MLQAGMRRLIPPACLLVALLSASSASALRPPVITLPRFYRGADAATLSKFYPSGRNWQSRGGSADLLCSVDEKGHPTCEIEDQTPKRGPFGAAAIRAVESAGIVPVTLDGAPQAGARVRLSVTFAPPGRVTVSEPELLEPPRDGRFVFIGFVGMPPTGLAAQYLRLPDTARRGGSARAWMVWVSAPERWYSKMEYGGAFVRFDCRKGWVDNPSAWVSGKYGSAADRGPVLPGRPGPGHPPENRAQARALALVCGQRAGRPVEGFEALKLDARKRLGAGPTPKEPS